MKIYDEITNEELTSPDLAAGYLYTARRVAEHVPESREVMQGTVTEDNPEGSRRRSRRAPLCWTMRPNSP